MKAPQSVYNPRVDGARARLTLAEVLVAFATAAAFTAWCLTIRGNPLQRLDQVSAIAAMGFRFTICVVAIVGALVVARRARDGVYWPRASTLACAALAGLVTAVAAAGVIFTLKGTPYGLNGVSGDAGDLVRWARKLDYGGEPRVPYPPLGLYCLNWYSKLTGVELQFSMKHLQIMGVAAMGPCAYVAWRMLLRPSWSLGIGLVASLPLIDSAPYRPYPHIVLIVLVPVLVALLRDLQQAHAASQVRAAQRGIAYGLGMGIMCLFYSGWFQWSALGFAVAAAAVIPWRTPRNALVLAGAAFAVFFALAGGHLLDALFNSPKDTYFYFDVAVQPGYIAMFRGDLPGSLGMWPPLGELGGVGVFTALLAVGLAGAIALGRGRIEVLGVAWIMVGCWVLRFYFAQGMVIDHDVRLYPRTTPQILYCLLILGGLAIMLAWERVRDRFTLATRQSSLLGAYCGLALLLGSAALSVADHYMPNNTRPLTPGWLSWIAHVTEPRPK